MHSLFQIVFGCCQTGYEKFLAGQEQGRVTKVTVAAA